jgi:hypothetical protein
MPALIFLSLEESAPPQNVRSPAIRFRAVREGICKFLGFKPGSPARGLRFARIPPESQNLRPFPFDLGAIRAHIAPMDDAAQARFGPRGDVHVQPGAQYGQTTARSVLSNSGSARGVTVVADEASTTDCVMID